MRLSEFELHVLSCFWENGELSAPDIFSRLGRERGVTYSTIKAIIDRLEKKEALARTRMQGRTIFYKAAIKPDTVRKPLVKSLLRRLYGNDLRPLFAHLLRNESLTEEELSYLRQLLDKTRRPPE